MPLSEVDRAALQTVLGRLQRHHAAVYFNEAVDPVALRIPLYRACIGGVSGPRARDIATRARYRARIPECDRWR